MKQNENIIKVSIIENEVEARLIDDMLNKKGIPHNLCSFYDSALNGIYQLQKGWGYIEAPERFSNKIKLIIKNLRKGN